MTSSNDQGGREARKGLPLQAASRLTGLVGSVMDLHVRIALKEADREKRRLIGGVVVLLGGLSALGLAWLSAEVALLLWLHQTMAWSWIPESAQSQVPSFNRSLRDSRTFLRRFP